MNEGSMEAELDVRETVAPSVESVSIERKMLNQRGRE
jgi:hypothetical protein